MTAFEIMKSGELYYPDDSELVAMQQSCMERLYDFNATRPSEMERRGELMKAIFAEVGEKCYIEPPLRANWGCNTHLGDDVYINFNLTLVDDADIFIGSHTMIGPNVTIATACHPKSPAERLRGAQYNKPVRIGENVWIGSGAIILPGVAVGDNSIVGAGAVVTRDVPPNMVAVGNPARFRPL